MEDTLVKLPSINIRRKLKKVFKFDKLSQRSLVIFGAVIILLLIIIGLFILLKEHAHGKRLAMTDLKYWLSYTDPQNRFSVLLPHNPKVSGDTYTSLDNGSTYTVSVTPASATLGEAQQPIGSEDKDSPASLQNDNVFQPDVQSLTREAGSNAKLIYATPQTDKSGDKYLDYKITSKTQAYKGRMFLVKNNIYVLLDKSLINDPNVTGFNAFLASFQLNQ